MIPNSVSDVIQKGKGSPYLIAECRALELIRSYPRNPQEGCYQFCYLVNRGTVAVNSLPKTVT